jgi:hypothetical protein
VSPAPTTVSPAEDRKKLSSMSTDTQISTAGELGSGVHRYRAGIDQVRFWVGTTLGP